MENNNINNSMEAIFKEYLEKAGIEIDTDISVFKMHKDDYIKLDNTMVGRIDSVMQIIPNMVNQNAYNGDVYRVVYDKGIGVLQKSAKYPGQLLGNVVSPDANNKIKDVARLQEIAMGPQLVNGVFSAMSMITGQYFMTQINNNLSQIEEEIALVQQYLENDKRSKLQSAEEFLKMTQKSLQFILENEGQKQSTITSIQKIKMDSLASINFYKMQINNLRDISKKTDKAEEIIQNVQKICFMISEYWYSLYLYCFAVYLELVVGQNFNSEYIAILIEDMTDKCNIYKNDYNVWKNELNKYIKSTNAFEKNKIYDAMKKIGDLKIYGSSSIIITKALVRLFGNIADEADKKSKEEKKDKAVKSMNVAEIWENLKPIEAKKNDLLLFDNIYNGRIELIKDNEEMYVKLQIK